MYLLEKNISLINTKKKYEFHKFTRRNPYDFEKHGNINYTKILKSMSNSKMKRSNSNLSTLNNSNENVNIKYQHSNNSLNRLDFFIYYHILLFILFYSIFFFFFK